MRAGVGIAFKGLGLAAALSPAIPAILKDVPNDLGDLGKDTLYNYTGIGLDGPSFHPDQTVAGIGAVLGGIVIAKIGSFLARRF